MNLRRKISSAIILYILILFANLISFFITRKSDPLYNANTAIILSSTLILSLIISYYYFSSKRVQKTTKEGLSLGIVLIVGKLIIEGIKILIRKFSNAPITELLNYYQSPMFIFEILIILLAPIVIAKTMRQ